MINEINSQNKSVNQVTQFIIKIGSYNQLTTLKILTNEHKKSNPNEELKHGDKCNKEPYKVMSEKERGGEVEDKVNFTNHQEKLRNRLCVCKRSREVLEQEGERNKLYN